MRKGLEVIYIWLLMDAISTVVIGLFSTHSVARTVTALRKYTRDGKMETFIFKRVFKWIIDEQL